MFLQSATGITKCDNFESATGITKCVNYNKVQQNTPLASLSASPSTSSEHNFSWPVLSKNCFSGPHSLKSCHPYTVQPSIMNSAPGSLSRFSPKINGSDVHTLWKSAAPRMMWTSIKSLSIPSSLNSSHLNWHCCLRLRYAGSASG